MNEITRIHIAKTAYDVEVAAKKQLEKYIKSLEVYTQDKEVLEDIEIRMTEILAERGVKAGGVISSDDIEAVRKQLGEPHEFADNEGDIAVGSTVEVGSRRLYRSKDNAVLGGVLSGLAAYLNVNPLWTRLVFVLLLFISFGFAMFVYILAWIIIPPARTATEKLQLAGKDVTLESIKELNADEEAAQPNKVAPVLQRILSVSLGIGSLLAAVVTGVITIGLAVAALTYNGWFVDLTNGFTGLGEGNAWIVWFLFGIVLFGLALLTGLLGLIAYAFLARKLTKRMVVSGVIVMALGIVSFATVLGVSTTQSWRVANETRSMVIETKAQLPADFASITSLRVTQKEVADTDSDGDFFARYATVRYVVDNGPARYELSALPTAKAVITTEGQTGEVSIEIPRSFRNSFVQPVLTVYGPALQSLVVDVVNGGTQVTYDGRTQSGFAIESLHQYSNTTVTGTYEAVTVKGKGSINLDLSTIRSLTVESQQNLSVSAGTVSELSVTQPDVCPSDTWGESTNVTVAEVTSGSMTYNGTVVPADSMESSCAVVTVRSKEEVKY